MTNDPTEHLTIPEVCTLLKISRSTFYYWRQTGRAPRSIQLPNRDIRITRAELQQWINQHTENTPATTGENQ
jgi:excisionase family DNA binding protein